MLHLEILQAELQRFQIDLASVQQTTLARYCDELVRWNQKVNLTGLHGEEMVRRLVVEPVWIGLQLGISGTLADIGSGNGSPGVPFNVSCRLKKTHLIEVRTKRAAFLRHIAGLLQLPGVVVHDCRFEAAAPALGLVDWITLQGIRLTVQLIDVMRTIALPTTRVVWITSNEKPPVSAAQVLQVPLTATEVFVLKLDHS